MTTVFIAEISTIEDDGVYFYYQVETAKISRKNDEPNIKTSDNILSKNFGIFKLCLL